MNERDYINPDSFVSGEQANDVLHFKKDWVRFALKISGNDVFLKLEGWSVHSEDLNNRIVGSHPYIGKVYLLYSLNRFELLEEKPLLAYVKTGHVIIAKNLFVKSNFDSKFTDELCKKLTKMFCLPNLLEKQVKKIESLKRKKEAKDALKVDAAHIPSKLIQYKLPEANSFVSKEHENLDIHFKKFARILP